MTPRFPRLRAALRVRWPAAVAGAIAAGALGIGLSAASAAATAADGLVCTTSASPNPTFTLTATTGSISLPDGNTVFMWSYAPPGGDFQYPGPVLCVNQGDTVTVTLKNQLPEATSIIFPGQSGVTADGSPVAPELGAGGVLASLANTAAANGGSITYSFVAGQPGTYLYESGTDQAKQVQMGLAGALVVRPAGHPDWAYADVATKFNPATEYMLLLSELDPDVHAAVEQGKAPDITKYRARYWLINGRSFPDTIAANNVPWLPTQPYGSMVHIHPYDPAANPDPALFRYINVGTVTHPFHPHGNHGRVIGRDGRELVGPAGQDLSYEKFTVVVGAGQTVDATYNWTDVEHWNPVSNPIPITEPGLQDLRFKDNATYYSGSPYLGYKDALPVGTTSYNQCGEYYHVMHSHALEEVTNFGAGFGGMLTLERVDPPLPNGCP